MYMDVKDVLNEYMYPTANDDARRKQYPYYDTLNITTGQTEYFYFVTPEGAQFLRNKQLPLAGSEIFFITGVSMYLQTTINTVALINSLNEMLQQSFLEIKVDGRTICKLPGADFLQYLVTLNGDVTPELLLEHVETVIRKFPEPILMNSTSAFEFKFVTTGAVATAFNTIPLKLTLHGLQLDKLKSGYWDNLKGRLFQKVPVTYYDTVVIPNGNEQSFGFFNTRNKAQNLFSQVFPLSDITTFECQNIEVRANQPDTPIVASTIYNSRINNILRINVDDVEYWDSNLQDYLSLLAGFAGNLTTAGADTLAYSQFMNVRQAKTLQVPLMIPANSKVNVSITQPPTSLGVTGELTLILRGVETRRVA